ncbi:hypothetical protein ACTHRH_09505 [Paenibacillus sp. SAFN-117]|uniref:hypothetical protein n=1 Tax=Paenibacillus sp. 32O-W TaxID=1695218 RepID=UPI001C930751|nr:hypothetical protein [Paenibacillus sp. 32O-W]
MSIISDDYPVKALLKRWMGENSLLVNQILFREHKLIYSIAVRNLNLEELRYGT